MDVTVRRAAPADAAAVARVHVRSWQVGYRGLMDPDYLAALDPDEWAQRYTFDVDTPVTLLAIEADRVVGHTTVSTAGQVGEVWSLYVDPERWGNGIGGVLLAAATELLRAAGFDAAELWALRGNERAMGFYRSKGWAPDGRVREERGRGGIVHVDECFVLSLNS
ncbi:hypothetical protein GOEFS_077_00550 [Gordonia effusa NBRC 100432]|uniref:N-acetyltransferase domain-containing protein n=1 Tax=Gordonia effusa NBRC 100432 TaxID=1077974 RepID=H0R2G2_9ACTN|nr:GNAT family N-acetyltransferase [Gordonia effusa]GAB19263.1 hypothetical protein GOEFS_077_00550 [Gordonia effusa NBRC 100432]